VPHQVTQAQQLAWSQILAVCPPDLANCLNRLDLAVRNRVEEVRLRLGQPMHICGMDLNHFLATDGSMARDIHTQFAITEDHLSRVLQAVTQSSLYAVEDELRRGFIAMPGGHRVGVAGRAVLYEDGHIRSIRNISSVNMRIAQEHLGVGDTVKPLLERPTSGPVSVLVISPPQCGKTTLLRDLARQWSTGSLRRPGVKVSIIDERSELAGCVGGQPQFQVGPRTDVLDACPKAEGLLMAIRSLSPDLVVTDEIGRRQDSEAILEATHAGVSVLASAHANSLEEWAGRPYMKELFEARAFQRYVILSRRRGPGTVERILDGDGRALSGDAAHAR